MFSRQRQWNRNEFEYLSRIYDSFSREERTTVNTIQGTGLGMSIVKSLVDLMGGSISVDSIQEKVRNL